jgi:hypothetical protein
LLDGAQNAQPKPVKRHDPPSVSDVGTLLTAAIETANGRPVTCGDCRAYLRTLDQTTEHDFCAIVRKLYAEISWSQEFRKENPDLKEAIETLVTQIVPRPPEPVPAIVWRSAELRWVVAITAAPRPVSSLQETIDSLAGEGWHNPIVFAEPGTPQAERCRWIQRPQTIAPPMFEALGPGGRYGAHQNFVQSMADTLQLDADATAIMYVQDDVKFTPGTRELLERDLWPSQRTGIVSAYCPNFRGYRSETPYLRRITQKNLIGALCYAMPRQAVEEMIATKHVHTWKGGVRTALSGHNRKALDAFAGHAMHAVGRKCFFYSHSLVEHFAPQGNRVDNSACRNGNNTGLRREWQQVKTRPVEHFPAPWVTWDCRGEQRFPTPRPDRIGPVAVIVPGYGLSEVTLRCLDALAESTIDFRLVYVDNGSKPEDFDRVKQRILKHFRRTTIIRSHINQGFTWAVNEGLKLFSGYHTLILNNDCRVEPKTIETLATHLEWHPQVASVAPLTNDKGACSLRRQAIRLAAGPTGRRLRVVPMGVLPWFCAMLHRDAIKLAPQLPVAAEVSSGLAVDDWWSRQLTAKGWRHLLCCDTYAEHDHATTFKAAGINRRQEQRKAARWLQKNK